MNQTQRYILMAGMILFQLCGVFPPSSPGITPTFLVYAKEINFPLLLIGWALIIVTTGGFIALCGDSRRP